MPHPAHIERIFIFFENGAFFSGMFMRGLLVVRGMENPGMPPGSSGNSSFSFIMTGMVAILDFLRAGQRLVRSAAAFILAPAAFTRLRHGLRLRFAHLAAGLLPLPVSIVRLSWRALDRQARRGSERLDGAGHSCLAAIAAPDGCSRGTAPTARLRCADFCQPRSSPPSDGCVNSCKACAHSCKCRR